MYLASVKCLSQRFAVSLLARDRRLIDLSPDYQRESGVWSTAKQQLFMDSLLNGYDIPKIYMHKLPPDVRDQDGYEYAVIDGKQRLSTIYAFLANELPLGSDFVYSGPPCAGAPAAGNFYRNFSDDARDVLKEATLDVTVVETPYVEDIEDLFSRLNNGEKLNAAESRNAFPGNMTDLIRTLAKEPFFDSHFGFSNKRYAYHEVACKLLYLEHEAVKAPKTLVVVDLKKKHLDKFVRDYKGISSEDASKLLNRVRAVLNQMCTIFDAGDIELSKQSFPQLMYLFTKHILATYGSVDIKARIKKFLVDFRAERVANNSLDEDSRDAELSEFVRLSMQGTNDAGSMRERINILTKRFLRANPDVNLKDSKRAFTMEERWALWQRSEKRCENCRIALTTLEELDGDHIVWWSVGGPTSLENARALCITCNRSHRGE